MKEFVKDTFLMNEYHDIVLLRLVELAVAAIRMDRPLFSNLLEEPAFYRKYFQVWIREALEERDRMQAAQAEQMENDYQ